MHEQEEMQWESPACFAKEWLDATVSAITPKLPVSSAALNRLRAFDDDIGIASDTLYRIRPSLAIQSQEDDALPNLNEALEIFHIQEHDVGVVCCLERIGEIHGRKCYSPQALPRV